MKKLLNLRKSSLMLQNKALVDFMKTYRHDEKPLKVFGVPFFEEKKVLERLPDEVIENIKKLDFLGKRVPGARIGFRTNSQNFTVKLVLKTLSVDMGMSLYAAQSANVMIGDRQNARFAGLVFPKDYETKTIENTFTKSSDMEEITIFLPRNEVIDYVEVSIDDDADIEPPTPYKYPVPILYYGSSITEGACCTRVTNAYNAIISNKLDVDYYNFGFSGSASGELVMADYFNTIEKSIFVLDYDYNAFNADYLKESHERFFLRIREHSPNLPIVILSAPNFEPAEAMAERRDVIKQTYLNAKARGDENVYFIDGGSFFGEKDRSYCTVDCIHPNDLGFYRMAETILPTIKSILEK